MKVCVVSSPTSEKNKTQASVLKLVTMLYKGGADYNIVDLSGMIDYFNPPTKYLSRCDSPYWLSPKVFEDFDWFIHGDFDKKYDTVLYSALFSPDLLVHGRHALLTKKYYPNCKTIIGGSAIDCLNKKQIDVLSHVFDYVKVGQTLPHSFPKYGLIKIKPFVTVDGGQGCNWGKCNFCNANKLSKQGYCPRSAKEIAEEFRMISHFRIKDIMISSNSFTENSLFELTFCLSKNKTKVPYNIMLRGDSWISDKTGESLKESGCTDVFIGAEALNNNILQILNKGTNVDNIIKVIKCLSKYVKITIGLINFIPNVSNKDLEEQLVYLEEILPYITNIEPEILSVIQETEFANNPIKYGIKLWATEKTINDSWCYGLSPDIPWTFYDKNITKMWFKYYNKLYDLIKHYVRQHYWDSIEHIQLKFEEEII